MARPKKEKHLLTRNDPRWRIFGRWLKDRRENNGIPLKTAAAVAEVSERQWSRYEAGESSPPLVRIPNIAKAVAMPVGRVMLRAGYADWDDDIDPETELRWVWTYLIRGELIGAFERLFALHRMIQGASKAMSQPMEGPTSDAFVRAVLASYRLPHWLLVDLIKFLRKRERESAGQDEHVLPQKRRRLSKSIRKRLSKPIQLGGMHSALIPPEHLR